MNQKLEDDFTLKEYLRKSYPVFDLKLTFKIMIKTANGFKIEKDVDESYTINRLKLEILKNLNDIGEEAVNDNKILSDDSLIMGINKITDLQLISKEESNWLETYKSEFSLSAVVSKKGDEIREHSYCFSLIITSNAIDQETRFSMNKVKSENFNFPLNISRFSRFSLFIGFE